MTTSTYSTLSSLGGFPFPVFVSRGSEERGRSIATRAADAIDWLGQVTGKRRRPTLVVADEQDWPSVCEVPIYGMMFSVPDKLGTSPTPAAWWSTYAGALRPHLSDPIRARLGAAFGEPPDYTGIADLIITHEATHLFHEIHPVTWASEFPADWVMELFANLGMHGYLATRDPDGLHLLAAMAEATLEAGHQIWDLQELARMGDSMQASVTNYVWYEFRLIRLAAQLWEAGGDDVLRDYQRLLGHPDLTHGQIVERLFRLEPAVAGAISRWPDP
ncbi:hypothetical protein [Nocardioides speluncae]|uniref:hypothetical protein n=1 Tax=Nocardioides speluncae TaxID=2670337 RepID=UPI0012B16971|nr:hypothetical protein [Nocardioides speluncae]